MQSAEFCQSDLCVLHSIRPQFPYNPSIPIWSFLMSCRHSLTALAVSAMFATGSVLLFYSTLGAAPPAGQAPFVDATVQREEMLQELRSIRDLIKEQNGLLKEVLQKNHGNQPAKR